MTARGVDLGIVEQSKDGSAGPLNLIVPNDVRINGMSVLVPSDSEIEILASESGAVTARLTVFVGKLRVHAEHQPDPVDVSDLPIHAEAFEAVYGYAG